MSNKRVYLSLTLERLWQFSLQYYSVREVKEACLTLQNHHHGNVNLLLLLKWLDEQGATIALRDWAQVEQCLSRSETLLSSFRELRRKLKLTVPDSLYRETLQFELQLEKQQQSDLVDCINGLTLHNAEDEPLTLRYCRQLDGEHLYSIFSQPFAPDNPTDTL
ncbi:TIGR02444 family protein [Vibrio fluminensis]|uniref:TIGR02444 family protein n=1 Tax=Vibrio fluminensis TaxID=2783614 RepID=UPI001888AD84|nr:TIGR02444 family protein [Vibrio fluminensis]